MAGRMIAATRGWALTWPLHVWAPSLLLLGIASAHGFAVVPVCLGTRAGYRLALAATFYRPPRAARLLAELGGVSRRGWWAGAGAAPARRAYIRSNGAGAARTGRDWVQSPARSRTEEGVGMPYIKPEARPELDVAMDDLIDRIKALPLEEQDGAFNYAVTRMLKSIYPHRYFHYNRAIGVLECIKQEFYRVDVGPYEDTKIAQSGAVLPHGEPGRVA
jgi:hypothetical protein